MFRPHPRILYLLWTRLLRLRHEHLLEGEALLREEERMGEVSRIILHNSTEGIPQFPPQSCALLHHHNSPLLFPLELVTRFLQGFRILQQDQY